MRVPYISGRFKVLKAPETNRRVYQLTEGNCFCYPLYYFIPSISGDYLIYHRADAEGVQLHRLNLCTGESVQMTRATSKETHWKPWCLDPGPGVLDHRSAINTVRKEVVYFDGNEAHAQHIETLEDRLLFKLPDDRLPISQNCVSPEGKWFIYIHHDKDLYDRIYPEQGERARYLSRGTQLCAYNFDTGEQKTLILADSPFHHVQTWKANYLVFSSMATERSILITDYNGGWYTHIRTQDTEGGMTCHYCATDAGIAYEVRNAVKGDLGGFYHPFTHKKIEFKLPSAGDTHVGFDPEGKLWFYESYGSNEHCRQLKLLTKYKSKEETEWVQLTGEWPVYASKQKSHHHPRLMPDRRHILFTAGDSTTNTNHIFLLDVSDYSDYVSLPGYDRND